MARTTITAWTWPAMGTTWRIYHGGGVDAGLAAAVARLVEDDEARWSRFRPGSDVARLTRHAGRSVHVAAETGELLAACIRFTEESAGVFNPLVGGPLAAWGYAVSLRERPAGVERAPVLRPVLRERLTTAPGGGTARIPAGTCLDVGGIAKSWTAVRAACLLQERCDDDDLLLDAGGDLVAARGDHEVAVEAVDGHPGALVHLREGDGIATSGWGRRHWRNGDGGAAHHLVDPATGAPGGRVHATVAGPDPVGAEVLAKVLALRPGRLARLPGVRCLVRTASAAASTPAWDAEVIA